MCREEESRGKKKVIIHKEYEVVVIGGGLSGVCAALACARHGVKTALVQNRPMLGGNASSEIRMHICGADNHGHRPNARETGIVEEILLENRKRNPQHSFPVFDSVMWEKATYQENLDLYLNTHVTALEMKDTSSITYAQGEQLTTEKLFHFYGKIFIDCTGDGTVAALAGAEFMSGREGKTVFGENHGREKSDHITMGNTLLFSTKDMGEPVPFEKPFWANTYTENDFYLRGHGAAGQNYWWIELGGNSEDVIEDAETIRDELMKAVYGIWDHIKNGGDHGAENFVLDWVGFLPGKRESRRVIGDYVLTEQDLVESKLFDDAVAYGGWPIDVHAVDGLKNRLEPTEYIQLKEVYTIPYRCLYSHNIGNLMIGGRAISATHMAFASTRVMATCGVVGQAGGTAAAMAVKKGFLPRELGLHIKELQQALLKDDCYIPGILNEDGTDVAKEAKVSCSSCIAGGEAENVVNGLSRSDGLSSNCWISEEMRDEGEWIELTFGRPILINRVDLKFDSNLSRQIMISMFDNGLQRQIPGIPPELAKDYALEFLIGSEIVKSVRVQNNYKRFNSHQLNESVECTAVRVTVSKTNGDAHARIFEVKVY